MGAARTNKTDKERQNLRKTSISEGRTTNLFHLKSCSCSSATHFCSFLSWLPPVLPRKRNTRIENCLWRLLFGCVWEEQYRGRRVIAAKAALFILSITGNNCSKGRLFALCHLGGVASSAFAKKRKEKKSKKAKGLTNEEATIWDTEGWRRKSADIKEKAYFQRPNHEGRRSPPRFPTVAWSED